MVHQTPMVMTFEVLTPLPKLASRRGQLRLNLQADIASHPKLFQKNHNSRVRFSPRIVLCLLQFRPFALPRPAGFVYACYAAAIMIDARLAFPSLILVGLSGVFQSLLFFVLLLLLSVDVIRGKPRL